MTESEQSELREYMKRRIDDYKRRAASILERFRLSGFKPYKCKSCGYPTSAKPGTERYEKQLCIVCFIKGNQN